MNTSKKSLNDDRAFPGCRVGVTADSLSCANVACRFNLARRTRPGMMVCVIPIATSGPITEAETFELLGGQRNHFAGEVSAAMANLRSALIEARK
jgi:hypothetical protein